MTTPIDLFQSGKLTEAVAAATEAVRQKPTDIIGRSLLCELLCFSGDLERADKQLDAAAQIDPGSVAGVSLLRHLIRSELSRREVFEQGRIPDFLFEPGVGQQKRLEAMLCLRNQQFDDAASRIREAEEAEPDISGDVDGNSFESFRDLDDFLGPILEVYTATGKYYWISCDQIVTIEFNDVSHLSDMLWRSASIETTGDVAGRVHIPAIYHGSHRSDDQRVRIGRATEWLQASETSPVTGAGQREFLAGDDAISIMQIKRLNFRRPEA